jgi:predicted house-cleaning noncanonical NTP pyrophosphatase (MazG superfamily)
MKDLQELVVRWLEGTYPNRTYQDVLIKFLEEVAEMFKNPNESEIADLMILILDLAHLLDIDLGKATVNKMLINGERKWQIDPETGIMHHVRP